MIKTSLPLADKLLWGGFCFYILVILCGQSGVLRGTLMNVVLSYAPLALLLGHACYTLTLRRGLALIALAGLVGFGAEAVSLNYGTLFGGDYIYSAHAGLTILQVPWVIIAYWAVFIYLGYRLVTSFLYWRGKQKPHNGTDSLRQVALLVLADGLAVTAIDLFVDPISVKVGSWTWLHGGPYFGVPIGNFVGWFCVATIASGLFRLFEFYHPRPETGRRPSVYLLPVLGYMLVGLNFLLAAVMDRLYVLAVIGISIVIAPAAASVVLYIRRRTL